MQLSTYALPAPLGYKQTKPMACSYCLQHTAQYAEEGANKLKFCSYTCQSVAKTVDDEDHLSLYMNALKLDAYHETMTLSALASPKSYGPGSELTHSIPVALRGHIIRCTKYVASLSLFEQFIVWRYTAGSQPVNAYLISGKVDDLPYSSNWCYWFFLYWHNTEKANGGPAPIHEMFRVLRRFFTKPDSFLSLTTTMAAVTEQVIRIYARLLQRLILNAPPVQEGFHVYKVASDYPGLPSSFKDVPKVVPQLPFNSTTINPHFNFAPFIGGSEAKGNLFDLRIPKGSHVLYVPSEFHAYPFQKEIILPHGARFVISSVHKRLLSLIDENSVNMVKLQEPDGEASMGPFYELNDYEPCKGDGVCKVEKKRFTVFVGDFREK